jgi:hypothetical protein
MLLLAEIACGNFSGHYSVDRWLRLAIVHGKIARAILRPGFCQLRWRVAPTAPVRADSVNFNGGAL